VTIAVSNTEDTEELHEKAGILQQNSEVFKKQTTKARLQQVLKNRKVRPRRPHHRSLNTSRHGAY
jgi:hypothetical protein